ncbi:MAG: hypothetical protein AAB399_01135 [Patescibacteria group bacterium]
MGKIFWLIFIIIMAVALHGAFTELKGGVKFENLSAIFKFPSGLKRATTTLSISVGGKNYANVNKPAAISSPNQPPKPTIIPPTGFSLGELSPFYGQVELISFSSGNPTSPSRLTVRSGASMTVPVDIREWRVEGNRDVSILIPGAVSDYIPSGLASESNLSLSKGETVNFYSNYSPIGAGLKLNKCTGYLNNTAKFIPELPKNCPAIYDKAEIINFSGTCQNLITSIRSCAAPTPNQINSIPKPDESQCRSILTGRTTYQSCYSRHRNDINFFSKEWLVWVQSAMNFDSSHDRLLLFDKGGLLVDEYVY